MEPTNTEEPFEPSSLMILDLWQRLWNTHRREFRNELVLRYRPLVQRVAHRIAQAHAQLDMDDLESFGLLGLIEAIDRFSEGSNPDDFPSYAIQRIRGAIYDELRRLDWLPRTVRRRIVMYRSKVSDLSTELQRTPSPAEIWKAIEGDIDHSLLRERELQTARLASLEQIVASDDQSAIGTLTSGKELEPETAVIAEEQFGLMKLAIERLGARQRIVVSLRFLGGLTRSEVASELSVSEMRVARIERESLHLLRSYLPHPWLPAAPINGAAEDSALSQQFRAFVESKMPTDVPNPAWLAQAKRNAEDRTKFLDEFGALSAEAIADLLGSRSRNRHDTARRLRVRGRIFGVETHGRLVYPGFQFDPNTGQAKPTIEKILRALPEELRNGGWQLALWWGTPIDYLGWRRPVDVFDEDPTAVINAATQEAAEWKSAGVA